MNRSIRFMRAMMVVSAFVALALVAGTSRMNAQICNAANITFGNNSNCPVIICLRAQPPVPCSMMLNPGGSQFMPVPANTNIVGVISAGGFFYPWSPSPIPGVLWVPNVTVKPQMCCVDIYYDPSTCTVKALNSTSPPPCNP